MFKKTSFYTSTLYINSFVYFFWIFILQWWCIAAFCVLHHPAFTRSVSRRGQRQFGRANSIGQLNSELDRMGTLTRTLLISAWSTPIWMRPASFERPVCALSNDAGLVEIGVDHAELRTIFVRVMCDLFWMEIRQNLPHPKIALYITAIHQ